MKIIKIIGVVLCLTILFSSWKTVNSQNVPDTTQDVEIEQSLENNDLRNRLILPNVRSVEILNRGFKEYPPVDQDQLTYLQTKPDDSPMFGFSLAVSDLYLAVGDINANRVVIYGRQADNSWLRLYEIYPPKPWFWFGKRKKPGFGYSLAINHDVLLIQAKGRGEFFEFTPKNELAKEEIYLVSLDNTKPKSLKRLRLSKTDLYYDGLNFLGDKVALVVRTKNSSQKFTSNVLLFDPLTRKKINNIKINDPDYNNLGSDELGIGSDNKSIVLVSSQYLLIEKPPLLITKNGDIRTIKFKKQDLKETTNLINHSFIRAKKDINISNNLFALGTNFNVTAIWEKYPQKLLIGIITPLGIIDSKNNDLLISVSRLSRLAKQGSSDYVFLRKREDKTIFTSDIRWSCKLRIEGKKSQTLGLVDEENLILSAYGTIAVVPIEILANSLEIYNPNCEAK